MTHQINHLKSFRCWTILTLFFLINIYSKAACTYTSKPGGGAWNSAATWTVTGGGGCGTIPPTTLGNNDFVVITSDVTLSGNLVLNNGSALTINSGVTLTVTGSITMNGTSNVTDNGSITAASFANNGSNNLTGTGQISTTGTIVASTGSIFGSFTDCNTGPCMTSDTFTLPVELTSFQANCVEEGTVNLSWNTASEHNSSHFLVERSRDGLVWDLAGKVIAAGNSNETQNYAFSDFTSGSVSYYRLTQVDIDGTAKKYDPIAVNCKENNKLEVIVSPNPGNGEFSVRYTSHSHDQQLKIELLDTKGNVLNKKNEAAVNGTNTFYFKQTELENGVYLIRITDTNGLSHSERYLKF